MFSLFKQNKVLFAVTFFLYGLSAVINVAVAFVLQYIFDAVVQQDWAMFGSLGIVVPVYIAVVTAAALAVGFCTKKLVVCTVQNLRQSLHDGILSRDTENYQKSNSADYISAMTNDVKMAETHGIVPILQVMHYLWLFLASAVGLIYYSPMITGIMLVCLVAMYLIPSSLGKAIAKRQDSLSKGFAEFTIRLKDQFSGYEVIRSFQLTERIRARFAAQNNGLSEKQYAVDRMVALSEGLSTMLGLLTQLLVMMVAGYMVLQGQLTAGVMMAIVQLSGGFVQPVAVVMQYTPMILGVRPVLERLRGLCEKLPSAFQGTMEPVLQHSICFSNVSFSYAEHTPVLRSLSAAMQKNKKYAVVGESGCGKTTMIKLLCANYSQYDGQITIDGTELHDLDIQKLFAQISVIHQNVYMFDESIRHNIDLHRAYDEADWQYALSASGVIRFLPQLENGLDTPAGENGAALSGGQRQRIAVARALLQKKPVLILDEGTSAVDHQTAYDIETALLANPNITIITITHSLSPILLQKYDGIFFMQDGKVAEEGGYDQLMQKNGLFADYCKTAEKQQREKQALHVD